MQYHFQIKGLSRLHLLVLTSISMLFVTCTPNAKEMKSIDTDNKKYELIVGAYTKKEGHVDGKAAGISQFSVEDKGVLQAAQVIASDIINPSYLQLSADGNFLYAASETGPDVDSVGYIHAYQRTTTGDWRFLNKQSSYSFAPCYVAVHPTQKWVAIANYVGGVVAMYPIESDGSLGAASAVVTLEGSSDHPRQESSHPHAAVFSPNGKYCYVPDLGSNKVWIFEVDLNEGKLQATEPAFVIVQANAGPRHFVFHPNNEFAYLANELDNTVVVFKIAADGYSLETLQTISTLPPNSNTESWVADIHLTPDGNHLYVSNRGENTLAHYVVNATDGTLEWKENYSTFGIFPRNFAIAPDGQYLYVANQNSDNIVIYAIGADGGLQKTGEVMSPTPVCLQFRSL